MQRISLLPVLLACFCAEALVGHTTDAAASGSGTASAAAIVSEMNLARQQPELYARFVDELRSHFDGNILALPGRTRLRTQEGVAALDEAIAFLRSSRPLAPLSLSPGMSRAAADHCADQASGGFGHGRDPGARMNRYGTWGMLWGENIAYGKSNARDIVLALIIDDGLRGRKHRKNIFNPTFAFAGAALGPHATFRTVCGIDFAGDYVEHGEAPSSATLVARNF